MTVTCQLPFWKRQEWLCSQLLEHCLIPSVEVRCSSPQVSLSFPGLTVPPLPCLTAMTDLVAALGETTGALVLSSLHRQMFLDPVGRQILRERPVINSETVNLAALKTLPRGTFGREYVENLEALGITPDTRSPVKKKKEFPFHFIQTFCSVCGRCATWTTSGWPMSCGGTVRSTTSPTR